MVKRQNLPDHPIRLCNIPMMLPPIVHWQFIGSNFSTALPPPCTLLMTTDSLSVPPEYKVSPPPPPTKFPLLVTGPLHTISNNEISYLLV